MNEAESRLEKPPRGSFLRAVLTMMSGTIVAQALPMIASPLLTRLYAPVEYGVYATFMLVSYALSAVAAGRYEYAIMLPEEEGDALNLAGFCFIVATIVAVFTLMAIVGLRFFGFEGTRLDRYLFAFPPIVFMMSINQTLMYWVLRRQRFRRLATANMLRALVTTGANIGFGAMAFRGGLIASTFFGQIAAALVLGSYAFRDPTVRIRELRLSTMTALMKEHRRFPMYTLPADLMSSGAAQLPVAFFDPAFAGLFTFVQTVINTPLSLAAGSVLDVFKERATRDYRERGEFRDIFTKVAKGLGVLAVAPMLVIAIWGTPLFAFVFGEAWRGGGHVARVLAVMYLFKFVASPISYSYNIVGKQRETFLLHIYILSSTLVILAIGMRVFHDADTTLAAFSANYALFYLVYLVRSYQFSRGREAC